MIGLIGFSIMLIVAMFMVATDGVGVEDRTETATVVELKHHESSSYTQSILVGKTVVTQHINSDESWSANVKINNEIVNCSISKTLFESLDIGQEVTAIAYTGSKTGLTGCRGLK
tara:strand:- start:93184 stop:93528 length:345 start_codon:yes stop_codon:yes gene_type:complete